MYVYVYFRGPWMAIRAALAVSSHAAANTLLLERTETEGYEQAIRFHADRAAAAGVEDWQAIRENANGGNLQLASASGKFCVDLASLGDGVVAADMKFFTLTGRVAVEVLEAAAKVGLEAYVSFQADDGEEIPEIPTGWAYRVDETPHFNTSKALAKAKAIRDYCMAITAMREIA